MNPSHHRVLFLFASGLASYVFGQSAAALKGTVLDPQGKPVPALVSVFLPAASSKIFQTKTSDGQFEFPGLAAGHYLIEASADGFPKTILAVDFRPDALVPVEIHLELQGIQQTIVVTAEDTLQSIDQIAKSISVIDRTEIDNRDEYSLTETVRNAPGLVIRNLGGPGQSTSIRSRGLGTSATSILIDGMRFRDAGTTQGDASSFLSTLNIIDPDRIEVLRGSGSSLYGTNAVGGVINVVTDEGGAPLHGDLQLEGGNLGLLRGRGSIGGAALRDRLLYSAGLVHLNVLSGVDGDDRARSTGGQGSARYRLSDRLFASVRFLGSDDFVQPNSSPTATGLPAANIPSTTVVPAIPFVTFFPSRDDPDNRRTSRFQTTALKLQQAVSARLNWQISYQRVDTHRTFENGPAGIGSQPVTSNYSHFEGGIDTLNARVSQRIAPWDTISGGYEFERETYLDSENNNLPAPSRVATITRAQQRSSAGYFQNQFSLLKQRLQISLSGRVQDFQLQRPNFVTTGTASAYASVPLSSPPRALTGDAAAAYFGAKTGTKIRAHVGNSYRAPALSERFGAGFFFDPTAVKVSFTPYGDPRLAPDRYNSFDTGIDQYFASNRIRVSGTYFYTRTVQVILFDSAGTVIKAQPDPFGRTSGYFNAAGAISRGVELSAEAHPLRTMLVNASYTYTNAETDQDVQVKGFFKAFAIPAHAATVMVNQQFGKKTDATVDLYQASSYYNPLSAAGRARAYLYPALTKLDLVLSRTIWTADNHTLRLYGKVDNLLNREYYETGFRTPGITWVSGLRMNFR